MFEVHIVAVYVQDQDRARDFYVNALGCQLRVDRPRPDGTRFVEVAPPGGGTRLSLVLETEEHSAGGNTGIVMNAEDIHAAYATLSERGVHFTQQPREGENGRIDSIFQDCDGNSFVLQRHPPRPA